VTRRLNPGPHGRHQVEVLLRAFEGGAFDEAAEKVRRSLRQTTEARDAARKVAADEALALVEEFLGAPLLPAALRVLRLTMAGDEAALGRPPHVSSWANVDEALAYCRWLLCADLSKALDRRSREAAATRRATASPKEKPGR
jgi:hypothetical protein